MKSTCTGPNRSPAIKAFDAATHGYAFMDKAQLRRLRGRVAELFDKLDLDEQRSRRARMEHINSGLDGSPKGRAAQGEDDGNAARASRHPADPDYVGAYEKARMARINASLR